MNGYGACARTKTCPRPKYLRCLAAVGVFIAVNTVLWHEQIAGITLGLIYYQKAGGIEESTAVWPHLTTI